VLGKRSPRTQRAPSTTVAFIAAAVLLGAAWTVAALQLRTRRVDDPRPVTVSRDLAARAVGCAQCAPVAVINTPGRYITTG
jgi:hypothetical protein